MGRGRGMVRYCEVGSSCRGGTGIDVHLLHLDLVAEARRIKLPLEGRSVATNPVCEDAATSHRRLAFLDIPAITRNLISVKGGVVTL